MAALIPLAITAGSSLISANQKKSAGSIAQQEGNINAKLQEVGAIQREADRKGRLARSLATQTAGAGARGISAFEGSPLVTLQESIRVEQTASERDRFNTRLSSMTSRARGSVANRQIKTKANLGLLSTAGEIGSTIAETR